jgi:hypothetical protein
MQHSGSCLCRAVSVSAEGAPMLARMCWCRVCQYLGSGNATVNAAFPVSSVTVDGPVKWFTDTADSGNEMWRGFCGECGTPLFSKGTRFPDRMVIRLGVFDDINAITPAGAIWTSSAPDWAKIDDNGPLHTHQPPVTP